MSSEDLAGLIREITELTGAQAPEVLAPQSTEGFYLVGLIGGKDVGKTALVNALAGQTLSAPIGYGRGTEIAIAYAHRAQERIVADLLERETPGRFRIITHGIPDLAAQVLLDLPDIDSIYSEHVQLTRRLLRHMLFPVWMQSVEKYADQRPQELLAEVARGNDAANFLFCLNKCDQAQDHDLPYLRDEYAQRLARVLKLAAPPRVWLLSATQPQRFDLPGLRAKLARQRAPEEVARSRDLAQRRACLTQIDWADGLGLPERVKRLERLHEQSRDLLMAQLARPLAQTAFAEIAEDPAHRLALVDAALARRVSRWPLVNLVHTLLAPLLSGYRAVAGRRVEDYLRLNGRELSPAIRGTFARIYKIDPTITELYVDQHPWEEPSADAAAADLASRLDGVLRRQRDAAVERLTRRWRVLGAPIRWTMTLGAALWFPIVQPVLLALLQDSTLTTTRQFALLLVRILSGSYLLQSAAFLAIWFLALWLWLRWNTARRVARLLARWRSAELTDPALSLAGATSEWIDALLDPIRQQRERLARIVQRLARFRETIDSEAPARPTSPASDQAAQRDQ